MAEELTLIQLKQVARGLNRELDKLHIKLKQPKQKLIDDILGFPCSLPSSVCGKTALEKAAGRKVGAQSKPKVSSVQSESPRSVVGNTPEPEKPAKASQVPPPLALDQPVVHKVVYSKEGPGPRTKKVFAVRKEPASPSPSVASEVSVGQFEREIDGVKAHVKKRFAAPKMSVGQFEREAAGVKAHAKKRFAARRLSVQSPSVSSGGLGQTALPPSSTPTPNKPRRITPVVLSKDPPSAAPEQKRRITPMVLSKDPPSAAPQQKRRIAPMVLSKPPTSAAPEQKRRITPTPAPRASQAGALTDDGEDLGSTDSEDGASADEDEYENDGLDDTFYDDQDEEDFEGTLKKMDRTFQQIGADSLTEAKHNLDMAGLEVREVKARINHARTQKEKDELAELLSLKEQLLQKSTREFRRAKLPNTEARSSGPSIAERMMQKQYQRRLRDVERLETSI